MRPARHWFSSTYPIVKYFVGLCGSLMWVNHKFQKILIDLPKAMTSEDLQTKLLNLLDQTGSIQDTRAVLKDTNDTPIDSNVVLGVLNRLASRSVRRINASLDFFNSHRSCR